MYANLKHALRNFEITTLTPHNPNTKIVSHFQLSDPLPPFFNKRFIFLGHPGAIGYLKNKTKIKKIDETNVLFKKNKIEIYEVVF